MEMVNPFPNNKILGWPNLKGVADDKIIISRRNNACYSPENIETKRENADYQHEENADYQHFLLLPQCFPKP